MVGAEEGESDAQYGGLKWPVDVCPQEYPSKSGLREPVCEPLGRKGEVGPQNPRKPWCLAHPPWAWGE